MPETTVELIKSYSKFEEIFSDVSELKTVTYCDSPELIHEFFEEKNIDYMEVIVGDAEDYRESLAGKVELADKLERLKENGKLRIYTTKPGKVHSKVYILKHDDGTEKAISGSPNMTKNAWTHSYQINQITKFETDDGINEMKGVYNELKKYGELFMDDLTEKIETSEEDRKKVIEDWTAGEAVSTPTEIQNIHREMGDQALEGNPGKISIPLGEYDQKTRQSLEESYNKHGIKSGQTLEMDVDSYSKAFKRDVGVPKMRIEEGKVYLLSEEAGRTALTSQKLDPEEIDRDLENIESYLNTIDKAGRCDNIDAVKAHMYEGILYMMWAPFVNLYADYYQRFLDLEKDIPYLYIHGPSNAGKGTWSRFVLRLISGNEVEGPLEPNQFKKANLDYLKQADTCFPVIIDDIKKDKIEKRDSLRHYWPARNGRYPALIFTSNDSKPKEWFRNRAKILHFDVYFEPKKKQQAELNRTLKEENRIFYHFSRLLLEEYMPPDLEDDILQQTRKAFKELYNIADRDIPPYFPDKPAEQEYNTARKRWQDLDRRDRFTRKKRNDKLVLKFDEDIGYEIHRYHKDLPTRLRARKTGREIEVKEKELFEKWLRSDRDNLRSKILDYISS